MKKLRITSAVVLLVLALVLRPAPGHVRFGPILQQLGPDSVLVVEQGLGSWALRIRKPPSPEWRNVAPRDMPPSLERNVFAVEGLSPDTEYEYVLQDAQGASVGGGRIHTAPAPGTGHVRFLAVGDSGRIPWWNYSAFASGIDIAEGLKDLLPGRKGQWEVAAEMEKVHADLFLHLGDLVYPWGRRCDYPEAFFLPYANLLRDAPVYPCVGNHDMMREGGQAFVDHFELRGKKTVSEGRYYAFTHGPVQFIVLNSFTPRNRLTSGTEQWKWLEQVLAGPKPAWRVVMLHMPLYTSSRALNEPARPAMRGLLHPLFVKTGVDLVLSGHDHLYERYQPIDGVTYVVSGAGGKSLYVHKEDDQQASWDNRHYGFLWCDADTKTMTAEYRTSGGQVLDHFRLTR